MELYNGWIEVKLNNDEIQQFYTDNSSYAEQMKLNQYLLLNDGSKVIDYFQKTSDGKLKSAKFPTIRNSFLNADIKPRNPQQYIAIDLLKNRDIRVKLFRGVFGSGKDFLMLHEAISLVQNGDFAKIVFIRPNVTVRDVPDIGYLPGSADEKLEWTLGPIYDKVGGKDGLEQLRFQGQLEAEPLLYIRGRSFENCIVYVTEGQNMTVETIKLLLGRIGQGSELWINGDTRQFDSKVYAKSNGLNAMEEVLAGNKLFGNVYLPITERDEVANLANLFDEYEASHQEIK